MNEQSNSLVTALTAGLVLGTFFFGGLKWTLRTYLSSPKAWLYLTGSMVIRNAVAITGFYFVGGNNWQKFLLCLIGFIISRTLVLGVHRES